MCPARGTFGGGDFNAQVAQLPPVLQGARETGWPRPPPLLLLLRLLPPLPLLQLQLLLHLLHLLLPRRTRRMRMVK